MHLSLSPLSLDKAYTRSLLLTRPRYHDSFLRLRDNQPSDVLYAGNTGNGLPYISLTAPPVLPLQKGDDPTAFKKNTRAMFGSVMRYLAGIHDAWERRYPDNHDRISRLSVPTQLQCTRGDLASLATIPVDYAVPIVALIIDCTHSTKWTVSACMVTTRMHGSCTMFAAVIPSPSSARRVRFRFSWGHGLHDPCMGRTGSRAEVQ